MSVWDFLALCASVFALLYLGWRLWDETHPVPVKRPEPEDMREVVGAIPQSCPGITVGDADVYCADDPIQSVMNFMQENRAATGL